MYESTIFEVTEHHSNLNLWHTLFEGTQKLNDCQAFKQLECRDKKWRNFKLYTTNENRIFASIPVTCVQSKNQIVLL